MEKIKSLLVKVGCKEELVEEICQSFDEYKTTLREQFEKEFAAKVEQAKKICLDETEAHKRELARRLQIFCETKGAAIEAQLARQSALSESNAQLKLKQIYALLEGIELNGEQNGRATAAVEKAKRQIQQLSEERSHAVEKANRQNAIAEKALKQNRLLVTENNRLKTLLAEHGTTVTENRQPTNGRPQRIDGSRTNGRPVTTRATIVENQDRRPPAPSTESHVKDVGSNGRSYNIGDIASQMDEDVV